MKTTLNVVAVGKIAHPDRAPELVQVLARRKDEGEPYLIVTAGWNERPRIVPAESVEVTRMVGANGQMAGFVSVARDTWIRHQNWVRVAWWVDDDTRSVSIPLDEAEAIALQILDIVKAAKEEGR